MRRRCAQTVCSRMARSTSLKSMSLNGELNWSVMWRRPGVSISTRTVECVLAVSRTKGSGTRFTESRAIVLIL